MRRGKKRSGTAAITGKPMKTLDIFPTKIFAWDWDGDVNELLDDIKEKCDDRTKDSGKMKNTRQMGVVQLDPYGWGDYPNILSKLDTISGFIDECLEDVRQYYRLQCEGLRVTTSWVNKYKEGSGLQWHRHPMSAFSGSIFLNDVGVLSFADPVHFRSYESIIPFADQNQEKHYHLQAVPGRVIIFPQWMEHSANTNGDGERWSLAFNTMPYGNINHDEGLLLSSARLEVK